MLVGFFLINAFLLKFVGLLFVVGVVLLVHFVHFLAYFAALQSVKVKVKSIEVGECVSVSA
jgi:hypothetical protein